MKYGLSDDTWSNAELNAISRVIASNRYTMGNEVAEYERQFALKVGSKYAIMSNSGSSANLLAIASLIYSGRLNSGDEVIVPAVSWSTTYFPLSQHNLKLTFVDVDLDSLNIDTYQIERAITTRTKAIFCVNLLGNPNHYDQLNDICKKYKLILVEDNCEALGGRYNNKQLGTFGLLGTYSTFYSHHLCTMEGGITVTDDEMLYHYMLCIRAHGWTRNLPKDSMIYKKNDDEFYESFNFIMPGYNLRPLEMEAAVGIEQLQKMDCIINQRIENAKYYLERLSEVQDIKPQQEISVSSWFGFSMILIGKNIDKRRKLVNAFRLSNIEVRPIVAGNFTRNKAIRFMNHTTFGSLKNADIVHDQGLFVGNHSRPNKQEVDLLIDVLKAELNK